MLGAAVGAVAAGGAGDQIPGLEDLLYLTDGLHLPLIQGLEVPHEGDIVLHLPEAAHAGQHHHHAGEARGEADGVAGGAAAVEVFQDGLGLLGQVHQVAALHRLHHQHRLIVLPADLIAPAALDGQIVIVHIVELDLHRLDLGVLGEDLLQELGPVVEGDAHMAHLALLLQLKGRLVGAALLVVGIAALALGMHQIEVEVIDAAGLQLAFEQGADIRLGLEEAAGKLVGQDVLVPGVAAGEAGLQRRLALALDVAVGGIKIIEARVQERIHHLLRFLQIHLIAVHGQAHAAESKIFLCIFHSGYSFLIPF